MREGWEIKKLGEVADVSSGNSAPQKKELFENGMYPFIRTSDVGQIRKGFISSCVDYLNIDGIKGLKLYKKGTILFPKSGASTFLNHRVIMEIDSYVSSHLATIKGNNSIIDDLFLLYFLTTIDARDLMQDIAYPSLKTSDISLIPIPLPTLSEQQRIVSILDESFAAINKAKANAEQNLKNARELFESYLQGVFEKKGEGWEERMLVDICEQITDGSHFSPKSTNEGEFPYITVRDIDNDLINFNDCKFINNTDYQSLLKNGCKPNKGDLLFSKDGTVGKVSLVDFEKEFVVLSSLAIIRPKRNLIDSAFLKYILKNPLFLQKAIGMKTGVAIRRIILKNLKQIEISFPDSIVEQQKIVRQFDAIKVETQKLESIYQKKISDLEELKKSLLEKAFRGELSEM